MVRSVTGVDWRVGVSCLLYHFLTVLAVVGGSGEGWKGMEILWGSGSGFLGW